MSIYLIVEGAYRKKEGFMSKYTDSVDYKNLTKLNILKQEFPEYVNEFLDQMIVENKRTRSILGYAYDIRTFLAFLVREEIVSAQDTKHITADELGNLKKNVFNLFALNLGNEHRTDLTGKPAQNSPASVKRKLAAIRTLYKYMQDEKLISENPTLTIKNPDTTESTLVVLNHREIKELINCVENYGDFSENGTEGDSKKAVGKRAKYYHNITKYRDLAIIILFLGTGIRVSECVGIDLQDLDFDQNSVRVTRKGGKDEYVYFNNEVQQALMDYLTISRANITPMKGHENALFLSMQKKRISVAAVENLVKKYAACINTLKQVKCHKLRSTYAHNLYNDTGDLYMVQSCLGHKSIKTTEIYAAVDENRKKEASERVALRQNQSLNSVEKTLIELVSEGTLTSAAAAQKLNMTKEEFEIKFVEFL